MNKPIERSVSMEVQGAIATFTAVARKHKILDRDPLVNLSW